MGLSRAFAIAIVCCGCLPHLHASHHESEAKASHRTARKAGRSSPQNFLRKFIRSSFEDRGGLVLRSTFLPIAAPFANYNPSIVPCEYGYLMSFRHDVPDPNVRTSRRSVTGLIRLDDALHPAGEPTYLKLEGLYRSCEDARLFFLGDKLYLCCCAFFPEDWHTKITLMEIDQRTLEVRSITSPDYDGAHKVEKNWTPLVYSPAPGKEDLYFLYSFSPHIVLQTGLEPSGKIASKITPLPSLPASKAVRRWTKKWGFISGGTPAVRIGENYLTFFHSHFKARKQVWYVMGAALLEGQPPFRPVKISPKPILFRKMFSAKHLSDPRFHLSTSTHVVFPSGFVEGTYRKRPAFHVLYGDNDSSIGILTVDKEKLFASLQQVR